MTRKPVILVVDDEPQILRVMRASLQTRGYEVRTAPGGKEALDEIHKQAPDLIILDLAMPDMSGLEVCRAVREFAATPIIVLSAKEAEHDKTAALDEGADDYVTKPFGLEELLARMRAVLRRSQAAKVSPQVLSAGEVTINCATRRAVVCGREVKLTPKEFEVLKVLVSSPNEVLTHRALLQAVWGAEYGEQTDYLRVFINQLRRKIEPDPRHPKYIQTEPWVGYRFVPYESC